MSCWTVLRLEPTSDKRRIKRAYANKLKAINIEEEQPLFQMLKEALDEALRQSDKVEDGSKTEMINDSSVEIPLNQEDSLEELRIAPVSIGFLQEFNLFYEESTFYQDLEGWEHLFATINEWDMEKFFEAQTVIWHFLTNHSHLLAKQIIEYLMDIFPLEMTARRYIGDMSYNEWIEKIENLPNFSFSVYSMIKKEKRTQYFTCRYKIYERLQEELPPYDRRGVTEIDKLLEGCSLEIIDLDLIMLHISYLIRKDFRLQYEVTRYKIWCLLSQVSLQQKSDELLFLEHYINIIEKNSTILFDCSMYNQLLNIPTNVRLLILGNAQYIQANYLEAKKYWQPLANKYATKLFTEEELQHCFTEHPNQTKSSDRSWNWQLNVPIFTVLILLIPKLVMYWSVVRDRPKVPDHKIDTSWIYNTKQSDYQNLRESPEIGKQFVYYFYFSQTESDREEFSSEHFTEDALEQKKNLGVFSLPDFQYLKTVAVRISKKEVPEFGQCQALFKNAEVEPFVIILLDEENKIKKILSVDWETGEEFRQVWEVIRG